MKIGLLSNFSCCDSALNPTISLFEKAQETELKAVFAPEHGFHTALQDQVRVPDSQHHKHTRIHSLYGRHRQPAQKTLKTLDAVVVDLPDIGTRYYTFLWSAILMARAAASMGKKVFVLDRPNPLNGLTVQGPLIDKGFESFVGLYSLPIRHGMTIGELCSMLNQENDLGADIKVIKMKGWKRNNFDVDNKLFWTMPSPNMPCFSTAAVYPGMCLLEGTNLSEGRGTTKPFEVFGAPYIKPYDLAQTLKECRIPGVTFRPTYFMPTFHKYRGELCGGLQIHYTNLHQFNPVTTGLHVIKAIHDLYPGDFQWRQPPYEFEKKKMPFDILAGNSWIRKAIEKKRSVSAIQEKWRAELNSFKKIREQYLLY